MDCDDKKNRVKDDAGSTATEGAANVRQLISILIIAMLLSRPIYCLANDEDKSQAALTNDIRAALVENLKKRIVSEKLDQKAEEAREKATSNPNDARLWCAYGQALLSLSGYGLDTNVLQQANIPLEKAVELNPKNARSQFWLGNWWMDVGEARGIGITNMTDSLRDFEKAKEQFLETQKLDPNYPGIEEHIAEADRLSEQTRMMIAHMEKMHALRVKHEKIVNQATTNEIVITDTKSGEKYRIDVSRLSPEQEENLLELETAVLNDPQNLDKRVQYAKRLSQCRTPRNDKDRKLLAKMKEQLDFVLHKDKEHLVALSLLGDYYRQLGDVKQAVVTFREVFAMGKPPVEALEGALRIASDREILENMV